MTAGMCTSRCASIFRVCGLGFWVLGLGFRVTAPVLALRNGVSRSVTVSLFVPGSSRSGFRVCEGSV